MTFMRKVLSVVILATVFEYSALAKQESWYWGFDLGWAKPSYSNDGIKEAAKDLEELPGSSRLGMGGSLFFYWPIMTGETIIGVAGTGIVDSINNKTQNNRNWNTSINQSLLAFSAMHTFGTEPGVGFFVRGDLGLASVSKKIDIAGLTFTDTSDTGVGFLAGAGYGIALSDSTRLLFQAKYSVVRAESDNYSAFQLCVGPLF